ncbi:MAG: SUMF1/EgtB/PvdO family nonheme iron enzyme, partial [Planctomycetales bacterium]|nr:SUMF1/EgtB/PvdO family nonheme iron enzyme [Planctomycetales bacterium]
LCFLCYRWIMRVSQKLSKRRIARAAAAAAKQNAPTQSTAPPPKPRKKRVPKLAFDVNNANDFVKQMLHEGRYALLLRPEVIGNLTAAQRAETLSLLHEEMTFTPEGDVKAHDEESCHPNIRRPAAGLAHAENVFVDRYPITNEQYKYFLDAGGYESDEYWDEGVFESVTSFVDQTGELGPRYWQHGEFPAGHDDHPVVGINWYEANACARWLGKRLPEGAEWVKTASTPVLGPDGAIHQRKYPWGNSFGEGRANTWSAGVGRTVPVTEFETGASASGAYQFVGNVWEWTRDELMIHHTKPEAGRQYRCKSIRGGAFDTYFECQATCHFESGDDPYARKANIGFRCVVSASELARDVYENVQRTEIDPSQISSDTLVAGVS